MKIIVTTLLGAAAFFASTALATLPVVAIHDSEFTRALETMPASVATPTGAGTTGNEWWPNNWHYFVMPDSVKEALRSDGTAFQVIGDSNIMSGVLTNADGTPKYPRPSPTLKLRSSPTMWPRVDFFLSVRRRSHETQTEQLVVILPSPMHWECIW
jgi:hypothetical protein